MEMELNQRVQNIDILLASLATTEHNSQVQFYPRSSFPDSLAKRPALESNSLIILCLLFLLPTQLGVLDSRIPGVVTLISLLSFCHDARGKVGSWQTYGIPEKVLKAGWSRKSQK